MANRLWDVQIDERKFAANMRRLAADLKAEAKKEVDGAANRFEKHVRRNVRKDSGDLAATITNLPGDASKIERVVTIGNDQVPYAAPLEFGHRLNGNHVPGARFWTPLKVIYNKRFKAALRRAAKRIFKRFQ